MDTPLGQWIENNAVLFRYIPDIIAIKPDAENILLSGGASILLSGVCSSIYPRSHITGVDSTGYYLSDGRKECKELSFVKEPFDSYSNKDCFDVAISILQIQTLNTRELTPYLYNLYDCLKADGVLYLAFPDAIAPTVMEKNLYPSWYSIDEQVYMKYYMADDVIRALSLIGFEIKAIEGDDNPDLGHMVTVICTKKH